MTNPTTRSTGNGRRAIRNAKFASNLVRRLDLEWWARLKAQREQDPAWVAKRDALRRNHEAFQHRLNILQREANDIIPVLEPTPWWERLVRWVAGH